MRPARSTPPWPRATSFPPNGWTPSPNTTARWRNSPRRVAPRGWNWPPAPSATACRSGYALFRLPNRLLFVVALLGMALAGRIQKQDYRVLVVMSDGECEEGSVWEAALFAPARKLENVAIVIDYNKWQATGRSNEIMALPSLRDKFAAFGWSASEADGHDISALAAALEKIPDGSGKPVAVVAHTIKGRGVSFMEDDNNWHYRVPTAEEVAAAKRELLPENYK